MPFPHGRDAIGSRSGTPAGISARIDRGRPGGLSATDCYFHAGGLSCRKGGLLGEDRPELSCGEVTGGAFHAFELSSRTHPFGSRHVRLVGPLRSEFYQPVRPPRSFQVIVHRGMSRQAPENTRPALERVIEDGFEWAEVDVRRTKDGHHVLLHDARVDGKTDGQGDVKEMTLEADSRSSMRATGSHRVTPASGC